MIHVKSNRYHIYIAYKYIVENKSTRHDKKKNTPTNSTNEKCKYRMEMQYTSRKAVISLRRAIGKRAEHYTSSNHHHA